MSPKDNIFPSAKSIVGIIKHIVIESEDENEDELEDFELLSDMDAMEDFELLSDINSDDLEAGYMEQIEPLSDGESETYRIYQHLLCSEEIHDETPTTSSSSLDGLFLDSARGVYHIRRRLFLSDASDTTDSDSSNESD